MRQILIVEDDITLNQGLCKALKMINGISYPVGLLKKHVISLQSAMWLWFFLI